MEETKISSSRLFIGIPVSSAGVTQMLREHPLLADLPVRWIRDEDLHITLLAPWNTFDIEGAKRKFATISLVKKFSLLFHTLETTPRDVPRLLWIHSHPSTSILMLKENAEQTFNIEAERRPFLPHITLARFIHGRQSNYVNYIHEPFSWAVSVDQVCLYQSHLSAEGSWYEKLACVILQ